LSEEDIKHLNNNTVATNNTEAAIKSISTKKSQGPDGFMAEFYQTFKEMTSKFHKLLQEIEREGKLPNPFYEAHNALIEKHNQDEPGKENYRRIFLMNIDTKILKKY
jgi:hypothetical protein